MTKRYSSQFKQEALHFIQIHPSLGIATIAKQLDTGYSTLDNWLRISIGSAASFVLTAEQQRIRQLEKQVTHLTEVNDILKKAQVTFISNPSR